MTCFRPDGHLTDAALTALVRGDCLEELDRLELAEHLAYCDPGPDAAVRQRKPVRTGAFHCALASGAGGHCPDKVDRRLATGVGGGPLRLLRPI